jgi:hypothetical protein
MSSQLLPLPSLLAELALVKRGLVLVRGRDYWRIEEAASQARREAASGPEATKTFLSAPWFFWTTDRLGKVIVVMDRGDEAVTYAVEPGSVEPPP